MSAASGFFRKIEELVARVPKDEANLAELLEQVRSNEPSITALHLEGKDIDDDGATKIAAALAVNKHVTEVWLRDNRVGDEGCRALASAFFRNRTVRELWLGRNKVGPKGAAYLAAALADNNCLEEVGLGDNDIREEGAASLAAALRHNHNLTTLDIHNNNIDKNSSIKEVIRTLLKLNRIRPSEEEILQSLIEIKRQMDLEGGNSEFAAAIERSGLNLSPSFGGNRKEPFAGHSTSTSEVDEDATKAGISSEVSPTLEKDENNTIEERSGEDNAGEVAASPSKPQETCSSGKDEALHDVDVRGEADEREKEIAAADATVGEVPTRRGDGDSDHNCVNEASNDEESGEDKQCLEGQEDQRGADAGGVAAGKDKGKDATEVKGSQSEEDCEERGNPSQVDLSEDARGGESISRTDEDLERIDDASQSVD